MDTIKERVRAGMALLDERVPGWEQRIDLDTLHLGDCTTCVMGHVFGSFNAGLRKLGPPIYSSSAWSTSRDFGFSGPMEHYGALTRAWKRAIRARLADQAAAARPSGEVQG